MRDEESEYGRRLAEAKAQARERAVSLGHRLEPFRVSRDGLYVAFCDVCRNVVIIDTRHELRLGGYALMADCTRVAGPAVV